MEDMLKVGVITSPHGVHGEVKVFPTTDDNKRFKKLKECYIGNDKKVLPAEVEGCKFFKNMVILKFKGYDNMNDVEGLRQYGIFVTREHAVKLQKDEYFITDMIDAEVVDEEGNLIGVLTEVLSTGANDVYVVHREGKGDLLIPAIKQCIIQVDIAGKQIVVRLMEGMD